MPGRTKLYGLSDASCTDMFLLALEKVTMLCRNEGTYKVMD